jgi:RimJ/RimL family protein N-acetyltransferase
MTTDDLPELLAIQEVGAVEGLSHIFPQDRFPFQRAIILKRWERDIGDPALRAYVSTDDQGAITGFAATQGSELFRFGIAYRLWGSGLATHLHNFVMAELERTSDAPYFWLRVFEDNRRARCFYEKLGWRAGDARTRSTFEPHPYLVEYRRDRM